MDTTCKCGTPLIDSDDGMCKKCWIRQVYEMGRSGPRWQTLAEARPSEGQQVCVDAADGRSLAAHVAPTGKHWVIYSDPRRLFLLNMSPTDRWHPWPRNGKN